MDAWIKSGHDEGDSCPAIKQQRLRLLVPEQPQPL